MNHEYDVRIYEPGDEGGIVELLSLSFDDWPPFDLDQKALDYWLWKYTASPIANGNVFLGVSQGRIVGVDSFYPLSLKIGGRTFLGAYASDNAVHPDFRRMGITKSVIELERKCRTEKGFALTYWTTGNPFMISYYLRNDLRFPVPVNYVVRIRDVGLHLRNTPGRESRLSWLGFKGAGLMSKTRNAFNRVHKAQSTFRISRVECFDEKFDKFWEEVNEKYLFMVERKRDYLNWRYCDGRAGRYLLYVAEDDEVVLGYCVLRVNKLHPEYPIGYVVDLLALPNRVDVADGLLSHATHYFDKCDVNAVRSFVVRGHPYERVLNRHGFLNVRKDPYIFYHKTDSRELDSELIKVVDASPDKMFFSYGDTDLI